jgi:superfamily II DNA or RNA helicase
MTYADFLASKRLVVSEAGPAIDADDVHPMLFDFQRDLVRWAVRKGRAALFADTGLGKTLMQVEWARLIGERTLIVAPLSVARQTVREAAIGTTGYVSVENGRRFIGCELKRSYYEASIRNIGRASNIQTLGLFETA